MAALKDGSRNRPSKADRPGFRGDVRLLGKKKPTRARRTNRNPRHTLPCARLTRTLQGADLGRPGRLTGRSAMARWAIATALQARLEGPARPIGAAQPVRATAAHDSTSMRIRRRRGRSARCRLPRRTPSCRRRRELPVVHVIGVLVHVQSKQRPAIGDLGVVGGPLMDKPLVALAPGQQNPAGTAAQLSWLPKSRSMALASGATGAPRSPSLRNAPRAGPWSSRRTVPRAAQRNRSNNCPGLSAPRETRDVIETLITPMGSPASPPRKTAGFLTVAAIGPGVILRHQKTRCGNDRKLAPSDLSFLTERPGAGGLRSRVQSRREPDVGAAA